MKRNISVFAVVLLFASAIAAWAGCNTIKSSILLNGGCNAPGSTLQCHFPTCGDCSNPVLTQDGGCNNDTNSQYCGVVANQAYHYYFQNLAVVGQKSCLVHKDLGSGYTQVIEDIKDCQQDSVKQTGYCNAGYNTPDDMCQ